MITGAVLLGVILFCEGFHDQTGHCWEARHAYNLKKNLYREQITLPQRGLPGQAWWMVLCCVPTGTAQKSDMGLTFL